MDIGVSVIRQGIPVTPVVVGQRVGARGGPQVPAGQELTIAGGDTVRVTATIQYRGPASSVRLYGAIGNRGITFDEVWAGTAYPMALPETEDWIEATMTVDIVTDADHPGVFDLYAKILEAPEAGRPELSDVIVVEAPPTEELIQHTVYPFAYIYDGDQELTTATFRTDPFVPSAWLADRFASKLEEEVRARGGRPLEVKVYVDTTPLLWTDFRIAVSSTPIGGVTEGVGIALWLAIILICLAITAVIVVATLALKTIMATFKTKPGLEDVKPAWGKETLILAIQDSEEYWERTVTPVETLQGMSEEELRHLLNEIAEEEVPTGVEWAAVAVVGVVAAGVVVAGLALARPTK